MTAATNAETSALASRGFSRDCWSFFFFFFFGFTKVYSSAPSITSSASNIGTRIVVPFIVGKLLKFVAGDLSSVKKF